MNVDRVAGIVLRKKDVLLMFRRNNGKEYYTFPGGGIEEGETRDRALMREILEETSITVRPGTLLYDVEWDNGSHQYFHRAEYVSGEPALGDFNERAVMQKDPQQYYQPMWVPVRKIPKTLLYPLEVRDLFIADIERGWRENPKTFALSLSTARQEL